MGELGVSIYPSKTEAAILKDYLTEAAEIGYSRIFTSMLELTDSTEEMLARFREVIAYGNRLGMKTSIDINPQLFNQLGVSYEDLAFFKDLGVWALRLDQGFTGLEEAEMSQNPYGLMIELNISRGQHYIDQVMDFSADSRHIIGSHNFYPQPYTGLDFTYFTDCAAQYKNYHLRTAAFIDSPKGTVGPWPVGDMLVSTEIQRKLSPAAQVQLLRLSRLIDDIFVGSSLLPAAELQEIYDSFHSPVPQLKAELSPSASALEEEVIFNNRHRYRGDYSGFMIRSSDMRTFYKNSIFPPADFGEIISKGDITICNSRSGQYQGELQIALKERPNDGSQNFVGKITEDYLPVLDLLQPWQSFELIR
ncbi:DUF871 domain-containing protein [Streptococcus chenjunshii]|uniref:DUF871 domain-containing protein n=1 Tax=Streptococcus chenjunshii TaxID=2173853 RepID=A0A372KPA6_9STRE|nr:MupG family TIM beta-alpha barrel fold protein [Streptococcus chenjunshii]AXQ78629.1 DUF871 domain-containing protein [Streptococcus chenjunshii]RFU51907.1 DUF871 domain-containing protein [Streptococcus chenjunshii]RFU54099.1 DUF871 domain-containing protein [Streptococcus chenjunshii]